MRRSDLQAMARAKSEDAVLLLERGRHSNAYYLAGYAVELGIKAVIARQFLPEVIPARDFVNSIYSHKLRSLIGVAGMQRLLEDKQKTDPVFSANWAVVEGWSEASRYEMVDAFRATALVSAVADPDEGILLWLSQHW